GVISHMEQTSDCAFDGPAYLFRCMTEVDDRDYVHLSEHKLPPLNFQLMKICNNTPHPRQVSRRPCQYWATGPTMTVRLAPALIPLEGKRQGTGIHSKSTTIRPEPQLSPPTTPYRAREKRNLLPSQQSRVLGVESPRRQYPERGRNYDVAKPLTRFAAGNFGAGSDRERAAGAANSVISLLSLLHERAKRRAARW